MTVAANAGQLSGRAGEAELLVQSIPPGREYTVDGFIDRTRRCRCAVPRQRLEVRGGEVSKGMTVRNAAVAALARRIAEALPGARGVLNVQIFHDETTDRMAAIEINPRFGGGYPLSHEAGAAMTRWLLEDILQLPSSARDDLWREGVVMLRYDEAVFCDRAAAHVAWGAAERHAP
jgi:carbamoyl-phosphate synthase large subunit